MYSVFTQNSPIITRLSRSTSVSVSIMVFNATFNNISAISWQSVLYVEEPGENNQPAASHWQTLSYKCCFKGERECVG